MKILALETMGRQGSVAALVESQLRAEQALDARLRAAQTITPTIQAILQQLAWHPRELDLIAVVIGPGSFTGLRIGVTTAKVLAYVTAAEVIGVDALEAIAAQAPVAAQRIHVIVPAERQQFFARTYQRTADGVLAAAEPLRIIDVDAWLNERRAGDLVTGTGLAKIIDRLPADITATERDTWVPRAATVGQLGFAHYQQGRRDDLWKLLPEYGRRSAAEEKADASESHSK